MSSPISPAWHDLIHHPVRAAAAACMKRFVAIAAGRGSGKTELAKRRLVVALRIKRPWPDPRYFFGAPTEQQAKRIAWSDLLKLIPKSWIKEIRLGELRIETVFGSSLQVVGLDKPQRIEGLQWDGGVVDESSDIKPGAFDKSILPSLTWRNGWCWRSGVPKRQGVGAREFREWYLDGATGKIADRAAFTWRSAEILDRINPAMLEYARNHMDPKDYREQFEASWETAGGRVFHAFDAEHNVRPCPYVPTLPLDIGCDFNVDPMAWVIGHAYKERVEWFDEIWLRDANTAQTLNVLWSRYSNHKGGFRFFPDATSQARKTSASDSDYKLILSDTRFEGAGHRVFAPRGNPRVADRFADCNAMFCNAAAVRRMFVAPNCKRLIDDLQSRHYRPGTSEPADAGDLGHITDAMGYAVSRLFPIRIEIETTPQVITITKGWPLPSERRSR